MQRINNHQILSYENNIRISTEPKEMELELTYLANNLSRSLTFTLVGEQPTTKHR